jgi:hypothetical protein
MRHMKNAYIIIKKHEGKNPFLRPRHRIGDNIKMDLNKCDDMVWIHLAGDRS